jgi:hypothetical protein
MDQGVRQDKKRGNQRQARIGVESVSESESSSA